MTKSLQSIENYKSNYINNSSEIFTKYKNLITEYLVQSIESMYMNNIEYYKYTLITGISTIEKVFKYIILYTKNLDLTYYHCQKSFYYYVEFISQIAEDNHQYLQLNCKDASLFVYKKTIFDLNNEYRKEFASIQGNCSITDNTNYLITLYNSYLINIITNYNFNLNNKIEIITAIEKNLDKLFQNILNLSLNIDEELYTCKLELLNLFNSNIMIEEEKKKIIYLELFIKKLFTKNNISEQDLRNLKKKLKNIDKLNDLSETKYLNWLTNDI